MKAGLALDAAGGGSIECRGSLDTDIGGGGRVKLGDCGFCGLTIIGGTGGEDGSMEKVLDEPHAATRASY